MKDQIITIVLGVVSLALCVISYYLVIRKRIQEEALGAINSAEDLDIENAERMKFAVETVYGIIPLAVKPFISRGLVEMIIQGIFDQVEEFAKKQKKD